MRKLAFYGKGGIGKSTTVSNLSVAFTEMGYRVLQIGCDPKADSTLLLRHGEEKRSVMDLLREKNRASTLDELVTVGYHGVYLVEAGGPTPGIGCAGRGIIAALELLGEKQAYEVLKPDIVLFDVLGDVVCGGFSMPIREGYADKIYILTSGEPMSIHAGMNIATAVDTFRQRGYATLGGVILNRRDVRNEDENVRKFCEDAGTTLIGELARDSLVTDAEERKMTVLEAFPDSEMAESYRRLARAVLASSEDSGEMEGSGEEKSSGMKAGSGRKEGSC